MMNIRNHQQNPKVLFCSPTNPVSHVIVPATYQLMVHLESVAENCRRKYKACEEHRIDKFIHGWFTADKRRADNALTTVVVSPCDRDYAFWFETNVGGSPHRTAKQFSDDFFHGMARQGVEL